MRKILFLDIDGVVNHQNTFHKYPKSHYPIDQYCAFLVGKIQLDTGCEVVLSSSWRHHDEAVEEIKKRVVPLVGKTGHCCTGIRGVEIHDWLQRNVEGFSSTYEGDFRIAILDDDSDMLLWQKPHFFQTSFLKEGLTDAIAAKVIYHLNGGDIMPRSGRCNKCTGMLMGGTFIGSKHCNGEEMGCACECGEVIHNTSVAG